MDMLLRYMRIDLRRLQTGMANQLLNHAYIRAASKPMPDKARS